MKEIVKIKCPCCGKTMVSEYEICSVCNWENDPIQLTNPEFRGGANKESLLEARESYLMGRKN